MTVRRPYWSLLSPGTDFGGYYVPIMDPEQKNAPFGRKRFGASPSVYWGFQSGVPGRDRTCNLLIRSSSKTFRIWVLLGF